MKEYVRVICPDSHGQHIDIPARDAFLGDVQILAPTEIVLLGDHVDCGGVFSSHARAYTDEMTESYKDDTDAANLFLDMLQRRAPKAVGYYLEGNHEARVEGWATRNFPNQKDAKEALAVFGPEAMLDLKRRGIRYFKRSQMYMGLSIPGTIRLGKCCFVHGISHSKHATYQHLVRFGTNVVHGHTHRRQSCGERTVMSAGFEAHCPGTLAKLQPLYKHTEPTSWSHGYAVQFVGSDGRFLHINVPIHKGKSLLPQKLRRV